MNRISRIFAAATLLTAAVPAAAATTLTFNTTSSTITSATGSGAGNIITFTSTAGGAKVVASAFQISQASGNAVSSQTLGAYSPGLGVTGLGDFNGDYAYHQVDNVNGYTDFILFTFDRAVNLTTIGLATFNMGTGASYLATKDSDLAFKALTSPFSMGAVTTSGWTTIAGSGANGAVATGSNAFATQWLVGAAFASDSNDGFKVNALTVSAVPEPGTWAMMLVGFGAMGMSLRSRRRKVAVRFA
ncbi:MAG: PEPxxWA-CTERM sorting domain-containing protein [Sphingomicrobium sp.]